MTQPKLSSWLLLAAMASAAGAGCHHKQGGVNTSCYHPTPLGTISDPVWQQQESNAEASDFVIHEHEWQANTVELNKAGQDHVKQIAARVGSVPFPVLVQQSSMTVDPDTKYGFPVHNNEELDMQRRQLIVQALAQTGISNAEERVVVSPALTPGFESFEAERAYNVGFGGSGWGFGGGFGGGSGGGMGGGGFY
jgi:hypothetical protein